MDSTAEQTLLANQVSHKTFEELLDITLSHRDVDSQGDSGATSVVSHDVESLIQDTLSLSSAGDEEWRQHYDALDNLRSLNKFNAAALEAHLERFHGFIRIQIDNLRSNNAKNALCFFEELFRQGGLESRQALIRDVLPIVLLKT